MEKLTKSCVQCGREFEKPYACGRPAWARQMCCSRACSNLQKIGKPSPKKGKFYRDNRARLPCRICGKPTKYHGTKKSSIFGLVHCGAPECKEESRRIKNANIRERHIADYAAGNRSKLHDAWQKVPRISREEQALEPWFLSQGWTSQFKFLTGIKGTRVPRCYWLDFALPSQLLCVEIDGSIHRLRKDRDARKDSILLERGWQVLRIPASDVVSDCRQTILRVEEWLTHNRTEKIT